MSLLISTALLGLTVDAHAKEELDPTTISEVAVFGFGGTLDIASAETSSGIGLLDAVNDVKQASETLNTLADGSLESAGAEQSAGAYTAVAEGLTETFGWEVWSVDTLVSHTDYAATWKDKTPKVNQNLSSWGGGLVPPGVLHVDLASRIKQDERDALIEALGVDGLVTVNLTVSGSDQGVRVGGVGTSRIKPKTTATVTLYVPGEKKHVWRATVTGAKTDEAIAADFGKGSTDRSPIVMESIDNAMAKLDEKHGAP